MPKKRSRGKTFKPCLTASTPPSALGLGSAAKPPKSVNELLADLRHTVAGPSSSASLPVSTPSVPPAIREILQLPETPPPVPRRPVRPRFDSHGRRLPAGPAPPRSWIRGRASEASVELSLSRSLRVKYPDLGKQVVLPDSPLPQQGSLIDMALRHLAAEWDTHRVYNQHHLFFVPSHLKPALIRYVGLASEGGITLDDLKMILLPPGREGYDDADVDHHTRSNCEITCLDLSASIGKSIRLRDVTDFLVEKKVLQEPQDSWETADISPSPSRLLLPNLTHLSLALDPVSTREVSWKQLLSLSSELPVVTHLSLAYWPEPCLNPRAKRSTMSTPQGHSVAYGGTTLYSHSVDHDWSEALLVLRILSKNLYKLEYLDLTGCAVWFRALEAKDGHDFVDWSTSWGKVTLLRLLTGWRLGVNAMASDRAAYTAATDTAKGIERHIRTMRAGRGRFITVERDSLVD